MRRFLTFIFTMVGMMVVFVAFMVYSYERSYNEWKSSRSGSKVTYPVENYASSSDRKNKDDLESLMKMFKQRLFPITLLEPVDKEAYAKAKSLSVKSPLSEQQIKIYLTKYDSYTEDTSQSAVNKLNIHWKERAVLRAKSYQKFHYSKEYFILMKLLEIVMKDCQEAKLGRETVKLTLSLMMNQKLRLKIFGF